jgi:uncharacterized membrane protein YbhN (UPF0104 family)
MKQPLKYIGYLLSLIFMYLTFRDVDYHALVSSFTYINVPLLVFALAVNVCFFTLRGLYQTSNLIYLKNNIPFSVSLNSIALAQCYNTFLPARIGELIRVFFYPKKQA